MLQSKFLMWFCLQIAVFLHRCHMISPSHAPCNYGFNYCLCDFVGINSLFYSFTAPCNYGFIDSLWAKLGSPIYRFLQAGAESNESPAC
jgi:inorganic pyrophosphatase